MATSLSPLQPGARARADSPGRGRHALRWAVRVLLLGVGLLALATSAARAAPHPAAAARLTSSVPPARAQEPGGVCQVPGMGDIGGLVGLCSQGSSGLVGDLNNICEPSLPQPEPATGGVDAMIEPPAAAAGGTTLYADYR